MASHASRCMEHCTVAFRSVGFITHAARSKQKQSKKQHEIELCRARNPACSTTRRERGDTHKSSEQPEIYLKGAASTHTKLHCTVAVYVDKGAEAMGGRHSASAI